MFSFVVTLSVILSSCSSTCHLSPSVLYAYPSITLKYCHSFFFFLNKIQFSLNCMAVVKGSTRMIYSWLCHFQGAFVENMMECVTAPLLKSVSMIERGLAVKWTLENVSWFLSEVPAVFIFPVIQWRMSFHCEFVGSVNKALALTIMTAATTNSVT